MSPNLHRLRRILGVIAITAFAAGCATQAALAPLPEVEIPDPNEASNRAVLEFNNGFNSIVTRPVAAVYRTVLPQFVRDRVTSGVNNLEEPTIFVNDILQGRPQAAGITLTRFLINSTIGLMGIFDVAAQEGLPRQTGDFGQTLYVWGVYDNTYRVAPIFGPTTLRDGVGMIVDAAANVPLYYIGRYGDKIAPYAIGAAGGLDRVEDLENVEATAIDYYIRLRSLYWQRRRADLLQAIGRVDESLGPAIVAPGSAVVTPGAAVVPSGPAVIERGQAVDEPVERPRRRVRRNVRAGNYPAVARRRPAGSAGPEQTISALAEARFESIGTSGSQQ